MSESHTDVVVFDLDGTLIDGDSTSRWITDTLLKSPLRAIIAVIALPIIVPMLKSLTLRPRAASFMIWLTTLGMSHEDLQLSFESFANKIANKSTKLSWRSLGLSTLENHQKNGSRVVIVTASPERLAGALFDAINNDVVVIGSTLKQSKNGWVGDFHCSHAAKCSRLKEFGYGEFWSVVYTDSPDDLPMLKQSKRPVVINCHKGSDLRKFYECVPNYERINW